MPVIHIDSLDLPEVQMFASLTERRLRNRLDPASAVFIAESPKVIGTALAAGYRPVALLCEERHVQGDAAGIIAACPGLPVYTGTRELLATLTGYTLTRGVLCAFSRPSQPSLAEVCAGARRVVVIHGVTDTTNIGAIFRSAAALGADAVALTSDTCDPFNRRAVRVSMGSVFLVPWAWIDSPVTPAMNSLGFRTVAMALTPDSVTLEDTALLAEPRLAIVVGTEGDGLPKDVISAADYTVCIPMCHGVDSLNVATAAGIAIYALTR